MAGLAAARCDFIAWPVALVAGIVTFACLIVSMLQRRKSGLTAVTALFLFGLLWGCISLLADARQMTVDPAWQNSRVVLSGEIVRMQKNRSYTRLTLTDVQRDDGAHLHGNIWLYAYASRRAMADFRAGDVVRATARLHVPRNRQNPGGFDFEAFCFDRHIALLGSASGRVERLHSHASWLEAVRQKVRNVLNGFPASERGVFKALLLAERDAIPASVYDVFTATGTAHLLAISGLHIGMVAGFGFVLCWWFLTRREAWIINLPVRGIALLFGTLMALAYATLAAWPLPTQRAVLLLAAAALAWWLRARVQPLNTLLAALMFILLLDAAAISSLSLWLSFVATACILLWVERGESAGTKNQLMVWGKALFMVTLIAGLATLPLVADIFGRLPVYGLPANLLMTPLYTLFVLPLALVGGLFSAMGLDAVAHSVFSVAAFAVDAGNRCMAEMTGWPSGDMHLPELPLWLGAAYVCSMLLAAWAAVKQRKPLAIVVLLTTFTVYAFVAASEHELQTPRFIVWDVGQGAASSLLLPGGKVLSVDAPGRMGSRFNGGTTVASGLRAMGLTHADVLVVSHAQSDHIGGMESLVRHLNRVGELWLADVPALRVSPTVRSLVNAVYRRGGKLRWLKKGDVIDFSDSRIRVLWPPKDFVAGNVNNTSLVVSIELTDGYRLLLPGDIEAETETGLLDGGLRAETASDLLLMPHHGSSTSSTSDFVAAVHPSLAIAQTGFANRYGFPNTKVVQRYRQVGSEIWNSANGAVIVDFLGDRLVQRRYFDALGSQKRKLALQWWHHFL